LFCFVLFLFPPTISNERRQMTMRDETFKEAAKITFWFVGSFVWTVLFQVAYKARSILMFRRRKSQGEFKEKFDRYNDPEMLPVDRSVGNFLEWQLVFMALFWLNALLTGRDLWVGWIYVFVRFLYPILALLRNGISRRGPAPHMFLATLPGYGVLIYYAYLIYNAL